jgi:hypothetical protein
MPPDSRIAKVSSRACILLAGAVLCLHGCRRDGDAVDTAGTATSTETSTETEGSPEPWEAWDAEVDWPTLECDPLDPEFCVFPFPNNVFTISEPGSPTGRRLALTESTTLVSDEGLATDPTPWNAADGFSAGIAAMFALPGARATGLADISTPEASLEPDSPTVFIEAESGRRIAHFVEIDATHSNGERRAFMIRAAERVEDGKRYIVGIRGVRDAGGELLPAPPAFAALRDGTPFDDPSIETRRGLYRDIFTRLRDADVEISELQMAWDWTTASVESNTGALLHMRDEALAGLGDAGPTYEIVSVEEDFDEDIAYRLVLEIDVPLYLDTPNTGARLQRGADGRPRSDTTAKFEVLVMIPHSAAEQPAALLQYGHGLLGGKGELGTGHMRTFANEYNYIVFGVDWIGMASDDVVTILRALSVGTFEDFAAIPDRLHQGLLNAVFAMRTMSTSFADDPDYGRYIDPDKRHYLGISQGGILGGTYMTISPDIVRGCLGVGGQPYALLLTRSNSFNTYLNAARGTWTDTYAQAHMISLAQMLWDRASANGYTHHLQNDPLPGTPEHHVIVRIAMGDHLVTHWGGHVMGRAIGAAQLDTGIRDVWGFDVAEEVADMSALVEYDFGLPEPPIVNLPMTECGDPHEVLRRRESARMQLDEFLRTGVIRNFCANGVCSYPELGGCD